MVVVTKSFLNPGDAWDFLEAISYSQWDEIGIRRINVRFQVYAKRDIVDDTSRPEAE